METKKIIDLRKCSDEENYAYRKKVIRLKKQHFTAIKIEELTGIPHAAVSRIWTEYKKAGIVPKPKTRGRKDGEKKLLSKSQEREIKKLITDKNPNQLKFKCFLWDLRAVRDLIKQRYGVQLGKQTVCTYLKSWGMSSQRPDRQAYKQNAVAEETFRKETYLAVQKRANAENGEVFFADETGIDNRAHNPRGYATIGQTPVVKVEVQKERVNMIAISVSGHKKFLIYQEKTTQQQLIDFMKNLILDQQQKHRKKVFLFLDNLKVHHGKLVMEFLEANKDKIEVFYFPSYSTELNPEEV